MFADKLDQTHWPGQKEVLRPGSFPKRDSQGIVEPTITQN
jgi:hypothetical protein